MRKFFISLILIISCSVPAISDELSFSDFSNLKDRVGEIGRKIGGLQACGAEDPYSTYQYDAKEYINRFRDILGETGMSREDMVTLDNEMMSEADRIRNTRDWVSTLRNNRVSFDASGCPVGDVCCVVSAWSDDINLLEDNWNWDNDKNPINAIKILSDWGHSPF